MKPYAGYKAEKSTFTEQLPVGAYVAKIIGAKEEIYQWGTVLDIAFDIAEGDYKGHFDRQFKNSTFSDKKWKGTFRLIEPAEGSQYFESNVKKFNNAMWAIEDSNKGYSWNWKENTLKNKLVGVLFQNQEWEYEGETGWKTQCCALLSVEDVRNGKFSIPKDKPLKNKSASASTTAVPSDVEEIGADDDTDDVPF